MPSTTQTYDTRGKVTGEDAGVRRFTDDVLFSHVTGVSPSFSSVSQPSTAFLGERDQESAVCVRHP